MKFTVVSHAGLYVEVGGKSVLCDPWLVGSCYWRSWWNCPEPPPGLIESLKPEFIYLTHLHWDHFHGPSLRRFDRRTTVIVPKMPTTRMLRDLKSLKFRNVIEVPHGGSVEIARGARLHVYQFGLAFQDSAVLVTDGRTTILNANDCKIFGLALRNITKTFPRIDFVLRSHSSAGPIPYCVDGYEERFGDLRKKEDYTEEFYAFSRAVGARYAIPFASNHCFLHRDTQRFNSTSVDPQMVADFYAKQARDDGFESECKLMPPGSSWSDSEGFSLVEFDYTKRDEYIARLLEKYADKLEHQYALEERTSGNFPAFEKYFTRLIGALPKAMRRFLPRFSFRVPEHTGTRHWVVDMKAGTVEEVSVEPTVDFAIETPAIVLNDCTRKRMFSAWTPSKRLRIFLRDSELSDVTLFLTLVDLFENDGLPMRNLVSERQVLARLARWRETADLARLFAKHRVFRRPFVGKELYAR